ncbi:MAG TPA: NRDE family protein, partial [Cytophagaceae bacterium]|nr:NRDE family protein [Cytophagaceae bacterium]
MCTVTYLPKPNGEYILTSSRDEKIVRPAAAVPQCYTIGGKSIVFPKDPTAGGSWIAYAGEKTVCLLNGGFKKHISNPPYKKSRGLVV